MIGKQRSTTGFWMIEAMCRATIDARAPKLNFYWAWVTRSKVRSLVTRGLSCIGAISSKLVQLHCSVVDKLSSTVPSGVYIDIRDQASVRCKDASGTGSNGNLDGQTAWSLDRGAGSALVFPARCPQPALIRTTARIHSLG